MTRQPEDTTTTERTVAVFRAARAVDFFLMGECTKATMRLVGGRSTPAALRPLPPRYGAAPLKDSRHEWNEVLFALCRITMQLRNCTTRNEILAMMRGIVDELEAMWGARARRRRSRAAGPAKG